jgi:hypothetical protein
MTYTELFTKDYDLISGFLTDQDKIMLKEIDDFSRTLLSEPGILRDEKDRQVIIGKVLNWCIEKDREKKLDDLLDN